MAAATSGNSVLSVSPFVTGQDAPYAGHRFYFEYLGRLSERFAVTVLAPDNEANRRFSRQSTPWRTVLVPARHKPAGIPGELATLFLQGREVPLPDLQSYLQGHPAAPGVVEMQWSAAMALAPALRRAFPAAYMAAFQYDRYSETLRWRRRAHIGLRGRLRDALAQRTIALQERWVASQCDLVAAFKAADLAFVRGRPRTLVIDPWLEPPPPRDPNRDHQDVLFVGAFDRRENVSGAMWLLGSVWPAVVAQCPRARLVLAGSNPGPQLLACAGPSVLVTGFVTDLGPFYAAAHCFVAPVFSGGGLRFKVPQALLAGVPLVATPEVLVGLEGLPAIAGVATNAGDFAAALVWALTQREEAANQAVRAQEWARERFSFETSVANVIRIYNQGARRADGGAGRQFAPEPAALKY
jgi:glycosyltransferase involved in cell wall biosynthesis